MKISKKNTLKITLALLLLLAMGLKMGITLISHFTNCNDSFAIEKSSEEGKDEKKEDFSKGQKKLLFEDALTLDHVHYPCALAVAVVCRYKLPEVAEPPQTVPTPPPNYLAYLAFVCLRNHVCRYC